MDLGNDPVPGAEWRAHGRGLVLRAKIPRRKELFAGYREWPRPLRVGAVR